MFKKILVSGGHGFLGQNVIEKLRENNIGYITASKRDGVDFLNFEQTLDFFQKEKPEAVVNCAAVIGGLQFVHQNPGQLYYQNVLLNLHLMEAARLSGVKLYINPLANCSYPGHLTEFDEADWWDGPLHESVLAYGFTKKVSWVQAWSYKQEYDFQTTNLILPNMYGPRDYFDPVRSHALGALIMKFIDAKEKKLPSVQVWGDGTPIREWLYVKDAAEICVKALSVEPVLGPINIGIGKGISILDLAQLIQKTVDYDGKIVLDPSKPNGAASKIMKVDKMRQEFNWEPKTRLEEGVEATIDWYQKNR